MPARDALDGLLNTVLYDEKVLGAETLDCDRPTLCWPLPDANALFLEGFRAVLLAADLGRAHCRIFPDLPVEHESRD
jgi:hypothetical protein